MADQRIAPVEIPVASENGVQPSAEFAELRELLVGPERRRIADLTERLDQAELTAAELAEHLPEAIALRSRRDQQIGRALAPTVETALRESIRRNPREIATAIFPVLGPAIRKAIAETMAGLVRSINSAVEHSLSPRGLRWRLESWRTGVPYPQIVLKYSLIYRVEQVFLIHAETGLMLAHVAAHDLAVPDADLISAMMTAIQDFVRDSFRPSEGGTLRTFSVGDHTVQVEAGPAAILAAVVRGQAPDSLNVRLQSALESIHYQFATALSEFSGDAAPFEPVRPVLEECLETVLSTERSAADRRSATLRWAVPLLAVVVVMLGFAIRGRIRWDRAIAALRAEPGIVVVERARGWGSGWRFAGLKDPDARDPASVIAAAGVIAPPIAGRWERYLSLDSTIVVARARRTLALSPAATADLRGDTLVIGGSVPLRSLGALAAQGHSAGITAVEYGAIRLVLPPRLDSLRRRIVAERILFDPGSAELTADESGRTREVAALVREMADGVAAEGGALTIEMTGRTDPTGTDQTNQALAQIRVDRVIGRLATLGIPAAVLRGVAVATSRPLTAPDPAEQIRINRSVSFDAVVGPPAPRRP